MNTITETYNTSSCSSILFIVGLGVISTPLLAFSFLLFSLKVCIPDLVYRCRWQTCRLPFMNTESSVRIGTECLHTTFVLLREVVWVRLHGNLGNLGHLLDIPVVSPTFDLLLNVHLFIYQIGLLHDVLVKSNLFLLQAWLEEALAHLFNYFVDLLVFDAYEFNPLAEEPWTYFNPTPQIKSIVLCAAVYRK